MFAQANTQADLSKHAKHLAEIHAAPDWLWPALVGKLVSSEGMTVEAVRRLVAGVGQKVSQLRYLSDRAMIKYVRSEIEVLPIRSGRHSGLRIVLLTPVVPG